MVDCLKCSIEDKIIYCCGNNPLSGETKRMKVGNRYYLTCPELTPAGKCSAYGHIHRVCREYQCHKIIEDSETEMRKGYLLRNMSEFEAKPLALPDLKK
jgi:hypothetical protein